MNNVTYKQVFGRVRDTIGWYTLNIIISVVVVERIETYFLETRRKPRRDYYIGQLLALLPTSSLQMVTLKMFLYKFWVLRQA